ncbi:cell division protein FtsA [Sphingomicrobium clamense]|uniref:Cell division protein FtsA n=1 Tax=Sphingomicrobium clamense TaxID=2851013 RepID=A0ABS6V4B6_9SPHN|nr:cell division protein FtsA [Sphingomicrobium sp. B8]MBW0144406.1 cell division protein FtsA [Sphingomicrobium sp. B8]
MADDRDLIAALDIGSSKVSALICEKDDEGNLRVLGTGQRESRGVKRGAIVDMDLSEVAVREAVDLAERMSGVTIDDVWASFAAGGLTSDLVEVDVELGGHPVEQGDIERLLAAGREATDREDQVTLHAHPALYTIDGVQGVKNPLGLHADRLGVDIHVIAADEAPLKNVDFAIRSAHLGVGAIIAAPAASAHACLSEDERDLGVALVELGADITNVSLHAGGMLVGLHTIPIGARDVSEDIAMAFGVPRRDAERMKCYYGSAMQSPRDNAEMIDALVGEGQEPVRITRAQLVNVIRQRIEEISGLVDGALKDMGFSGPVGRQVVITGGGADLKNMADYMQGVLGRNVRVGRPKGLPGLPEAMQGPGFSTLVGLARLAARDRSDVRDLALGALEEQRKGGLLARLVRVLRQGS